MTSLARQTPAMDPRLRAAVDASLAWYDAIFAVHGLGCSVQDGLWTTPSPPPPLHSAVKTVEPGVDPARVVAAARGRGGRAGVADSFADLGLDAHGLELLFEARWIHRAWDGHDAEGHAPGWTVVRTAEALAAWTARHGTTKVLLPGVLDRSSFQVLARGPQDAPTGGAVLHLGTGVVAVTNVWSQPADDVWPALVQTTSALWPGRDLVGYEHGDDLTAATAAGFADVGPHLIWV